MEKTVRVGMMPGKITEFAVEEGMSISEVLALAAMNPSGYDVKVDGVKVDDTNATKVTSDTSLILLARQVKGNSEVVVRVGMMPGRITEVAVEEGATIASVLSIADLNPSGYDVKVDGVKCEDVATAIITSATSLILLAKQVKGNV